MSQSGIFIPGGPIPPTGPVYFLEGNIGGQVPPDGTGTIHVVADDPNAVIPQPLGITISGDPGANTLNIQQIPYTVQTVGNVPETIYTLPLEENQVVTIYADVVATNNLVSTAGGGGFVFGTIRRAGAGAAVIAAGSSNIEDDFAIAPGISAVVVGSGNNAIVRVTGVTGATIDWKLIIRYVLIG